MKIYGHKTGFTIVEIIIVVAIIAILTTMVIGIATRIDSQSKERLMVETFELLDVALEEFAEYGHEYNHPDYAGLDFPIDCNGFSQGYLEAALGDVLDVSVSVTGGDHEDNYSGSEAMYFLLSRVPSCRATLDKIHRPDKGGIVKSLITNKDAKGSDLQVKVDDRDYPLLRVIDPWGETLRYDYYEEQTPPLTASKIEDMQDSKRSFPLITSAGPDGIFGNSDDITNKK